MAVRPFLASLKHVRKLLPVVEKTMGALLVLTGIAHVGWIAHASYWLIETFQCSPRSAEQTKSPRRSAGSDR